MSKWAVPIIKWFYGRCDTCAHADLLPECCAIKTPVKSFTGRKGVMPVKPQPCVTVTTGCYE